jgi:hypothetical protein
MKNTQNIPLTQSFPPFLVERDIWPIAITNAIAKVCEPIVGKLFSIQLLNLPHILPDPNH